MTDIVAEFTIQPFVEGEISPHVGAGLAAAQASGLAVDIGPFGTTVSGPHDAVVAALSAVIDAAMAAGATAVQINVARG